MSELRNAKRFIKLYNSKTRTPKSEDFFNSYMKRIVSENNRGANNMYINALNYAENVVERRTKKPSPKKPSPKKPQR